jgi:phosphopantothenoylcysteine synthetase/decarboxylase
VKLLITAGPTREAIDPVRFLSNRSSGKMGYAFAQAAIERGHEVTLISGPVCLTPPPSAQLVQVLSAQDMYDAVQQQIKGHHAAIFAAAVADYRPAEVLPFKFKKGASRITLDLEKNPDILGSARSLFGFKGVLIGFAAETEDLIRNATGKLQRKMCDLVIANNVAQPGIGFDSEENEVTVISANAPPLPLRRDSKLEIARALMERIEEFAARKFGKNAP